MLIHDKFPEYWGKLAKNPHVINNITNFFNFFMPQLPNVFNASITSNPKELQKKLNHIYTLFFSQTKEFILKTISPNPKVIRFNFLLQSVKHRPEITQDFLNIFFPHIVTTLYYCQRCYSIEGI